LINRSVKGFLQTRVRKWIGSQLQKVSLFLDLSQGRNGSRRIVLLPAPIWILVWLVYPAFSKGLAIADAGLWHLQLMTLGDRHRKT
jgi:hypothetical protein